MKQSYVLFFLLAIIFTLVSCEEEPEDMVKKETLSAKWIVTGSGTYESFEFNESGNYIVAENNSTKTSDDPIVHYGIYEIINGTTVDLIDFGTMNVSSLEAETISFTLTLASDPGTNVSIEATKQEEMESTSRTDLLCRTWSMVSINGESVVDTDMELNVLFSPAGTYFVEYLDPESSDGGLARWQWKDAQEEWICYSWDGEPTCTGDNEVLVSELTSGSLTIIEEEETYYLEPVSNKKSAGATARTEHQSGMIRGMFLK